LKIIIEFLFFSEENINSSVNTPIKLLSNPIHDETNNDQLQAFGMIDLNAISSKKENNLKSLSKITYAVFESSVSFDYNSSLLQNGDFECSSINSSQIISNVIMIKLNAKFSTDENFVLTKFRTLEVRNLNQIHKTFYILQNIIAIYPLECLKMFKICF